MPKVEDVILQDRRVKVSVIAHELGISTGTVSSIIHSVLMMAKVSSPWVPRMLTPEQKACRQQFSEENLDMLRENPEKLFSRIITGMKHGVDPGNPVVIISLLDPRFAVSKRSGSMDFFRA